MNILVNATNIRTGGGVQKAAEFVRASLTYDTAHRFCYALSRVVANNLGPLIHDRSLDVTIADVSPSRPWSGRSARRTLDALEGRFRPDVVFSIFGPTYKIFRCPHLMGFAVGWITHPNSHAWHTLRNPVRRARHWAWCKYVAFWARFADRWVLESDIAADGLSKLLRLERQRFHVVPNVCSEQYYSAQVHGAPADPRMSKTSPSDFNLLVFSAWYPHKNLEIVPLVAAEVRRRDPERRYRFFLTFDTTSSPWRRIHQLARRLGVEDSVVNLGPIMVSDGPSLYFAADALFLPTVLETFTATYPEAMCTRRPIVTSDLPFAREICGAAAIYSPPNDASRASAGIVDLARTPYLQRELVSKGQERLASFKSPRQVYEMLIDILAVTAGAGGLDRERGAPRARGIAPTVRSDGDRRRDNLRPDPEIVS